MKGAYRTIYYCRTDNVKKILKFRDNSTYATRFQRFVNRVGHENLLYATSHSKRGLKLLVIAHELNKIQHGHR